MGNKVLYVTGVIDTELWNKAGWCGTAVLSVSDGTLWEVHTAL